MFCDDCKFVDQSSKFFSQDRDKTRDAHVDHSVGDRDASISHYSLETETSRPRPCHKKVQQSTAHKTWWGV